MNNEREEELSADRLWAQLNVSEKDENYLINQFVQALSGDSERLSREKFIAHCLSRGFSMTQAVAGFETFKIDHSPDCHSDSLSRDEYLLFRMATTNFDEKNLHLAQNKTFTNKRFDMIFKMFDLDSDGVMSKQEALQMVKCMAADDAYVNYLLRSVSSRGPDHQHHDQHGIGPRAHGQQNEFSSYDSGDITYTPAQLFNQLRQKKLSAGRLIKPAELTSSTERVLISQTMGNEMSSHFADSQPIDDTSFESGRHIEDSKQATTSWR